ncbi:MAG: amino acid adenylation domain-containing protein, partial [bacterium]|nr:amino acid adenylation domain-containing protein [bacterium]
DATAVDCEGRTLSCAQLNSRANQLARVLVRRGVGHESIVAICLGPTPEAVVAILAVLKAGGAYLPLDPAYPDERLSFMVTDSAASMVLTDSRHAERFASADRVDITTLASEIDAEDVDDLEPVAGADSLAYVIYTSGSTGEPKGTLLEHRGLCNTVHALIDGFRIDEESRLLQFASASFDASVADIFCALVSGATLCLAPRDKMLSPDDLVSLVRDMNATFVTLPPTMLRLLEPGDMPSLRTVVSAGERCPADLAQTWVARDGLRFVNGYGPTENTVCTTMWVCSDHDDPVPIGRPIPNVRVYVLDETGHPVPQGAPGELCIGGAGLARGYLNRPDLTAERFIQNPLDDSSTSRLYRTGDWVRFRDDGALEYLGRTDGQIKVRGFRVELGEIESALRDAPAVKDAVASVTEGARGDGRLMVYIVSDGTPDVDALRAHLRRSLPEYMMPSGFAVLDRIPMTPSGKVDRAALPVRGEGQLLGTHHGHEERTPIQETVAEIWGHVLETPPPGNHDNFFDLGGHSILSVHVIAQVKKRFGVDIPLPRFFAAPTVAGMAEIIQSTQEGEGTTDTDALPFTCVPIRPTGSRPPFFCVATAGGVLFPYFKLAPLMSPDQPLYGLQDPALDGEHPQIETVEELAAHYVEVMCMVEPRGPYMFGGYSFGGIVAFEMAQQLVRAGKEVALVVLMDNGVEPPEFRKPKGVVDAVRLFSKRFPFLVESLYNVKPHIVDGLYILGKRAQTRRDHAPGRHRASPLDYLRWLWTDLILSKAGVANVLSKDAVVAMRVPSFKPVMKLLNVNGQAGESYRPQVYPGKVTLFRASRRPPELQGDSTLGWDRIAEGGVDTRHISGDHMRMLGDSVAEVADNLDDCIRIALKKHDAAETSPAEDSV